VINNTLLVFKNQFFDKTFKIEALAKIRNKNNNFASGSINIDLYI